MTLPSGWPARVLEVDLEAPAGLDATHAGRSYRHALALARAGDRPLGLVALELPPGGLPAADVEAAVRAELGDAASRPAPESRPASAPPPSLGVVIATRERPERLAECLDAVFACDRPVDEVLVVDNAPATAATKTLVEGRAQGEPRLRYLVEHQPGAASARDAGLAALESDAVAFVDDDVLLDRRWTGAVADAFAADEAVLGVSTLIMPRQLDTEPQLLLEQFGGFAKGFERQVFDTGEHRRPDPLYPYSPGVYGTGAAMAFRARALRALGGFDRRLTSGGEDLDLFLKVVLSGGRLVYEPAAVAWHLHPADLASLRRTMFTYGAGLTALMTKWCVSEPRIALAIARRLPAALRLALDPASRKNVGKPAGYPRTLTRIERKGMLAGPFLFARAALADRRARGVSRGTRSRA
jgi:GT2 family glycosyltransferase